MERCFTNILSGNVEKAARFYEELLGMTRHYDSDWFIILTHSDLPGLEVGILDRDHETVPAQSRTSPAGVMLTFVVEDSERVYEVAQKLGAQIIQPPTDMPYGQTRLLVRDEDGVLVDISSRTK